METKWSKISLAFYLVLFVIMLYPHFAYSRPDRSDKKETLLFGVGGLYNFQTESFGVDARILININNRFSFVPKFSYYLPGSNINEFFIGADIYYYLLKGKFQPYLLIGGAYNKWINSEQYPYGMDNKENAVAEGGGGILFNIGCRVKPYLEYRYSVKWQEGVIGAGLIFSFGECYNSKGYGDCPAYRR